MSRTEPAIVGATAASGTRAVIILSAARLTDAARRNFPVNAVSGFGGLALPDDVADALFAEAVARGVPVEQIAADKLAGTIREMRPRAGDGDGTACANATGGTRDANAAIKGAKP